MWKFFGWFVDVGFKVTTLLILIWSQIWLARVVRKYCINLQKRGASFQTEDL